MNLRVGVVAGLLAGCAPGETCEAVTPGVWTASGTCFGVARTLTTAFDEEACRVSFQDWATVNGGEPTGGVVTGSDVALEGGAFEGCVGDVDGTSIIGTCPDGCAFELGTTP